MTTALREYGHDVDVYTKSFAGDEELDWRGVKVHRVVPLWDRRMRIDRLDRLVPRSVYAPYQDLKAASSLWRRWKQANRKSKYDIVQVANVQAVGWYFRKLKGTPVVTRLSSYRPAWDTAFGVEETREVRWRWWMEKKAVCWTRHIYAATHFVAGLTEEHYGLSGIRVIESPFHHEEPESDTEDYDRYCRGKDYVLYFGRQTQMKGVHFLAQALPEVMKKNPDMHAVFVGSAAVAPDGGTMHDWVKRHLSEVSDRLVILDSVRHDRLYPIVSNARIVALPSLIDNLPNTCLEAMALSRPVLATTGTCFEQLIDDGRSGLLVKPECVESLQAGLQRAWALSTEERASMGAAAAQRIHELRPEVKVPELIQYYEEILKKQSGVL